MSEAKVSVLSIGSVRCYHDGSFDGAWFREMTANGVTFLVTMGEPEVAAEHLLRAGLDAIASRDLVSELIAADREYDAAREVHVRMSCEDTDDEDLDDARKRVDAARNRRAAILSRIKD